MTWSLGVFHGKILGMERVMKGGIGCDALQTKDLQVGALVAVNCLGDVIDPPLSPQVGLFYKSMGFQTPLSHQSLEKGAPGGSIFCERFEASILELSASPSFFHMGSQGSMITGPLGESESIGAMGSPQERFFISFLSAARLVKADKWVRVTIAGGLRGVLASRFCSSAF